MSNINEENSTLLKIEIKLYFHGTILTWILCNIAQYLFRSCLVTIKIKYNYTDNNYCYWT